jgi:hypothetical protein
MISAQQAAKIMAEYSPSLQLHLVWNKIKSAALRGHSCITVDHLSEQAQQELLNAGYALHLDECNRGTSFWVVSWKDAAVETK